MNNNGDKLEEKKEEPKVETTEQKTGQALPPKDFKIAEIWIKEGQLILDASPEFWIDKLRALGVLEMCKDIVKKFEQEKPKVMPAKGGIMDYARRIFGRKR